MSHECKAHYGIPYTCISTSKIADHSALSENAVNRIRGLACTLIEEVQTKIGMNLNTNNTIWSWAARHASWLLNRYRAVRGATPYTSWSMASHTVVFLEKLVGPSTPRLLEDLFEGREKVAQSAVLGKD